MTRQHGTWVAACVLAVVALAAVLLWSSRSRPPDVARPEPAKDTPTQAEQPAPEPLPDGVIRGVCGHRFSGGPPRPPGEPYWWDSPQAGHTVEVREEGSGKKVAEAVAKSEGKFEVRVRPGSYRVVADYGTVDAFGKRPVERAIRVEPGKVVELDLLQDVLVP